jgi:O-antigen ligase
MQTSNKVGRGIALLGLALIAETIVKTSSRGAFIGASAVGIALLLFLPGISVVKRAVAVVGIVGVMAWFAPDGYWQSMQTVILDPKSDYNWNAVDGRREIAKRGMSYMMQYPVFGVGIDNFAMAEGTISEYAQAMAGSNVGVKWSAPHNSWVEAGAETGIPGLLTWAALVVGSSVGLLRLRRRMPREWATSKSTDERFLYLATLYVPIAFIGFAVCGTFVSFAWSDQSYILPAIALGVHRAYEAKIKAPAAMPANASRIGRRGARVFAPTTA